LHQGLNRNVDTLQHCKAQPGLCEPFVEVIPITPHCKYIILMTDGVYKSIEAPFLQKGWNRNQQGPHDHGEPRKRSARGPKEKVRCSCRSCPRAYQGYSRRCIQEPRCTRYPFTGGRRMPQEGRYDTTHPPVCHIGV
ncbi:hypothetical protein GBAR_LOCUS19446, partial [Geodia barretti]